MAETRTARRRREAAEAKARERGGSSFDLAERAGSIGDAARSHPGIIITLVAVILAVVMLYAPTRNYYVAWRSSQDLQAYYQAISEQNEALLQDVGRLTSQEGIEDEARRRGYVYPNEEALVADGVEEEKMADPDQVEAAINSYEESLPWYVHVLDSVFGYTRD